MPQAMENNPELSELIDCERELKKLRAALNDKSLFLTEALLEKGELENQYEALKKLEIAHRAAAGQREKLLLTLLTQAYTALRHASGSYDPDEVILTANTVRARCHRAYQAIEEYLGRAYLGRPE